MARSRVRLTRVALAEERAAWLFLAPSLVLFAIFTAIPVISAFFISFTQWNLFNEVTWVGLGNYIALAQDEIFAKVLGNTAYFVLVSVPVQIVLALLCALVLNRGIKGQTFFRVVYFLPVVTSTIAAALA